MTHTLIQAVEPTVNLRALNRQYPQAFPCLLEGGQGIPNQTDSWDILFWSSGECIEHDGTSGNFLEQLDAGFFDKRMALAQDKLPDPDFPFVGGWILYLGYELAADIEPRLAATFSDKPQSSTIPRAVAVRSEAAIIRRRADQKTWLVAESEAIFTQVRELLRDPIMDDQQSPPKKITPAIKSVQTESEAQFFNALSRIDEYIRSGDVFQVNYSRKWQLLWDDLPNPSDLFQQLTQGNPAPFSALFRFRDWAIISSSPERLLSIDSNVVETRPIAGTRPRHAQDHLDSEFATDLQGSEKDRAEHIMLLDMERNDLGRVCRTGSVTVSEFMALRQLSHVQHIESVVRGQLKDDWTPSSIIRATFPGGSISGCPKVRCMEIIAELEPDARGHYTGSLGYLSRHGKMDLNILIRSLFLRGNEGTLRAGAGIVADSDPHEELKEVNLKAASVLASLNPS